MNSITNRSRFFNFVFLPPLLLAAVLLLPAVTGAATGKNGTGKNGAAMGKTFSSPEEAVRALTSAVNNRDSNALAAIFGPGIEEVRSEDPVQTQNEVAEFARRLNASNHIQHASNDWCILEAGEDRWPFAIPIVRRGGSWFFDTEAGKEELINRRIGRDELEALKSIRAYVDAQREYASKDRDGDGVLEYAQKLMSSPGAKDGLYWSQDLDGEESPLGLLYAEAQRKGYFKEVREENGPRSFNGYYFKILTRQGRHAAGGKYDYVANGNMIGGFAMVAWPAEYGESGVMTFIINQQGKVYQKDLGPRTEAVAAGMKDYDPDSTWTQTMD